MSNQKQTEHENTTHFSMTVTNNCKRECSKTKKIYKNDKMIDEDFIEDDHSDKNSKKKKLSAKEVKRLREQNRRANHKEYVSSLEEQISQKELQIQNLNAKIKNLEQQLGSKVCNKCRGELLLTENCEQIMVRKPTSQESSQQQIEQLQEFQRIDNQSSLRICFGNKNLFFFLVTMCCLTMGSIADVPDSLFSPMAPHKYRYDLCLLSNSVLLNKFSKPDKISQQIYRLGIQDCYSNKILYSPKPNLHKNIQKVSTLFNFDFDFTFNFRNIFSEIKNSVLSQLKNKQNWNFMNMQMNNLAGRIFEGRNYYR